MENFNLKVPVFSHWESNDVVVATDDKHAYLAMIDPSQSGSGRFDGCGTAEIDINTCGGITLIPCHDTCSHYYAEEFARLERATDGVNGDYRLNARDAVDAVYVAAKRAGISLAGLEDHSYDVEAVRIESAGDLDSCYRVFMASRELTGGYADAAYEDTKLHAAELNSCTWVVSKMSVDAYRTVRDNGEVPNPLYGEDCVYGFIWGNVDSMGESTPTEEELLNAM